MISTDHNFVSDWRPQLDLLVCDRGSVLAFVGIEFTTCWKAVTLTLSAGAGGPVTHGSF